MNLKYEHKIADELVPSIEAFAGMLKPQDGETTEAALRRALTGMAQQVAVESSEDLQVENRSFKNSDGLDIQLRVFTPQKMGDKLPGLYWMHGGGTISGLPEQEDSMLYQMALEIGCIIVSVNYRLAPENPYPKPINDCFEGLLHIVDQASSFNIDATRIAVGGASAGGLLSTSCAILARENGRPKLVHQSLTYPMLDHRGISQSSQQITDIGIWDTNRNLYAFNCYLKDVEDDIPPLAVPNLVEDLSNLPSTYIAVGTMDCLRDECIEYAQKLAASGVITELHIYPGMTHAFEGLAPESYPVKDFFVSRSEAIKRAFVLQ